MPTFTGPKLIAFGDLARELAVTRKILAAIPTEHFPFKPHPKSMSFEKLAVHVATLPGWITATFAADELNFATMTPPATAAKDTAELLSLFDTAVAELWKTIDAFDMSRYESPWTCRNGDQILATKPRSFIHRVWCFNHMIHHRAQLALYLRLCNLPVPTLYFNTADDPTWLFD